VLSVDDMPAVEVVIGKIKRARVSAHGLAGILNRLSALTNAMQEKFLQAAVEHHLSRVPHTLEPSSAART
jgi:hypothetical protein